jgi:hypothetical protein
MRGRRTGPFGCDSCGVPVATGRLPRIAVVPLRAGVPNVRELALCHACRSRPTRSIWLRYRRAGAPV